jgi:hypothetical protein
MSVAAVQRRNNVAYSAGWRTRWRDPPRDKEVTMLPDRVTVGIVLAGVLSCTLASPLEAAPRVFISAAGADIDSETRVGNNCGPASPCRTFGRALRLVDDGGEVVVLASGNYEPFLIRKPVTVVAAPGVHAVITAPGLTPDTPPISLDSAVTVATTGIVVLRGLTLMLDTSPGVPPSTNVMGINAAAADVLHVEDCVLNGLTHNAITFGSTEFNTGQLYLRNTTVTNSGSDFASAVYIAGGSVSIDRLRINHNRHGVVVDGGTLTMRDSVASNQIVHAVWARALNGVVNLTIENSTITLTGFTAGGSGIIVGDPSAPRNRVRMSVSNSTVTHNATGISVLPSTTAADKTTVWVSNTTIARNNSGVVHSGGVDVLSRGNNTLEGNDTNGDFTGGFSAK